MLHIHILESANAVHARHCVSNVLLEALSYQLIYVWTKCRFARQLNDQTVYDVINGKVIIVSVIVVGVIIISNLILV